MNYIDEKGRIAKLTVRADGDYDAVCEEEQFVISAKDLQANEQGERKWLVLDGHDALPLSEESAETALSTQFANRQEVVAAKARLQKQVDSVHRQIRVMEQKRREIQKQQQKVQGLVNSLSIRVSYLTRYLDMITSYLGIGQKFVHIKQGEPSAAPIHIVQSIFFMDEEVQDKAGRTGQVQDVDYRNVEEFDKWLLKDPANVEQIAPYEKCVVALYPSRQEYKGLSPLTSYSMRRANRQMYLLVRNGECLSRIYTSIEGESIAFFPLSEDYARILQQMRSDDGDERYQAKSVDLFWLRRIALLQGIIDNTEILSPHDSPKFDRPQDHESGRIVMVRNLEAIAIGAGMPTYRDWKKRINEKIKVGSRILFADRAYFDQENRWGRFTRYQRRGNNFRPTPQGGVYQIVGKGNSETDSFKILFYGSDVYDGEFRKPKRREGFIIYAHEWFVLNYDELTLEDVTYYIGDRRHRYMYQNILPTLYRAYRELKEESDAESEFVTHFALRYEIPVSTVIEAVNWWKKKNKWKRPLSADHNKAWRMIRTRLSVGR